MSMRKVLFIFVALLLVFGFNQSLNAQRGGWIHLGDKHVDGRADHDTIKIGSSQGTFNQLQIRVRVAPVYFQRVVVHFHNGSDEELEFRERIKAGGETRALDLRGTDREIKSVEFWYERARWGRREPEVELWGRR